MTDVVARLGAALADRYVIERELGAGGMATVYLAHDVRHDRKVALKVLRPELSAILGGARFLSEIKTTANLQHPHILQLFDSGEADGTVFYVMPFVEGESLRDRLTREKQLPVDDAVRIAKEVASALDYAHRHNVVHRDIKPENILLQDGTALVADFGIALAASRSDSGTRMTETGMSLGTPHYMAPEQAMGEKEITPKADIYALGCVLYESLAGEPPFTGPTAQAVIARVMTEQPRSLTLQRHTVPPAVEAVVRKALEKLPADRFATAADFAAALANPGFAATATVAQPAAAVRPPARALRAAAPWTVTAAAVAVTAWALLRGPAPAPPSLQFVVPARITIAAGNPVGISEDGTDIVFVGATERGQAQLFARRLDEAAPRPIADATGNLLRDPVFSPGGEQLAYYADQRLRVVPVAGGAARALTRMSPISGGIAWAGPDRIVFQADLGEPLSLIRATGGQPQHITTLDTADDHVDHRWPWVLRDGKTVLFTIWRGNLATATLATVSLDGGPVREIRPGTFPRFARGYLIYRSGATIEAVRYDPRRAATEGEPFPLVDRVFTLVNGMAALAVSRGGTLVALAAQQATAPVRVSMTGAVTELGFPIGGYESPRYSPRGDQVAVSHTGGVWIRDLALGTFGPLGTPNSFYPVWARNGRTLYYSVNREGDVHVYRAAVDRSSEPQAVIEGRGQYRTQSLSPDGRHLLLRVNNAPAELARREGRQSVVTDPYDIWLLTLDSADTPPRPWLATQALERAPAFSPDGRWVAYSSDESGSDEIYVRPFPGPGGRTQVSTGGGSEPAWMPDGRGLVYRSGDQFMLVGVRTGAAFAVLAPPRLLFAGDYFHYAWSRQYDIHPDGRSMIVVRSTSRTSDVRVLVNWVERAAALSGRARDD